MKDSVKLHFTIEFYGLYFTTVWRWHKFIVGNRCLQINIGRERPILPAFYNEIDGAKKKIQQALILVRLTELNKGRIEKPQKRLHSKK